MTPKQAAALAIARTFARPRGGPAMPEQKEKPPTRGRAEAVAREVLESADEKKPKRDPERQAKLVRAAVEILTEPEAPGTVESLATELARRHPDLRGQPDAPEWLDEVRGLYDHLDFLLDSFGAREPKSYPASTADAKEEQLADELLGKRRRREPETPGGMALSLYESCRAAAAGITPERARQVADSYFGRPGSRA